MAYYNTNTDSLLEPGTNITMSASGGVITINASSTGGGLQSGTASGTDTYTVTIGTVSSYTSGDVYAVKFTNANTGASTININSLGAKALKKSVSTALASGDILAGQEFIIVYDGTNFQVIGIAGSATITGSDTQVTFFDGANNPAGDAGLVYNKTTDILTVAGGVIVTAETASRIASFDGSKQVKALDTATYPSLTELAYVKGVTSAIQTQIGTSKAQTLSNYTNSFLLMGG